MLTTQCRSETGLQDLGSREIRLDEARKVSSREELLLHLHVSPKKCNTVPLYAYGLLRHMHRQAHGPCWSLPNMQGANQRGAALELGSVAFLFFLFTVVPCLPVNFLSSQKETR